MSSFNKKEVEDLLYGIRANSYNRFPLFYQYRQFMTNSQYWYGLRIAYTDSDDLYPYSHMVKDCFYSNRQCRHNFMNNEEREYLQELPDRITIYRGMTVDEQHSRRYGVSWSLSRDVAEFFATKYARNHATENLQKVVHTLTVPKYKILGYCNDRKEQEVIYLPHLI